MGVNNINILCSPRKHLAMAPGHLACLSHPNFVACGRSYVKQPIFITVKKEKKDSDDQVKLTRLNFSETVLLKQ